ncbi:hypothetical protein [Succinatimonas hippei]|uniref:hypothetical protein n=1 Tax=Succinatimonas hippei TaxID=626938 RepID=UPI00030DB47C|nr:hypothetical protein [Succinatimonas hippei]
MDNKYKDWIDIIKNAASTLFVAFLAQIANIFYFKGDLVVKIYLYLGAFLTVACWLFSFYVISYLRKKGAKNVN